jgi:hypothetical protein
MERTLLRLKILFLVLFLLGASASLAYHLMWVKPSRACAERGGWWAPRSRVCGTPIDITDVTGRPRGAAAAAAPKAAQPRP